MDYRIKELLGKCHFSSLPRNASFSCHSYLNALIQTLLFTPEFRGRSLVFFHTNDVRIEFFFFLLCLEPLFRLTPTDLNLPANPTDQNAASCSGKVTISARLISSLINPSRPKRCARLSWNYNVSLQKCYF